MRKRTLQYLLPIALAAFCALPAAAAPFAYVGSGAANNVSVIDLATNTIAKKIPVGTGPAGIAVNQASWLVYVVNSLDKSVSIVSVATNAVVGTVPLAQSAFGIALNPAGTRAVVTHADARVALIDTITNKVVGYIPLREQPLPARRCRVFGAQGGAGRADPDVHATMEL